MIIHNFSTKFPENLWNLQFQKKKNQHRNFNGWVNLKRKLVSYKYNTYNHEDPVRNIQNELHWHYIVYCETKNEPDRLKYILEYLILRH